MARQTSIPAYVPVQIASGVCCLLMLQWALPFVNAAWCESQLRLRLQSLVVELFPWLLVTSDKLQPLIQTSRLVAAMTDVLQYTCQATRTRQAHRLITLRMKILPPVQKFVPARYKEAIFEALTDCLPCLASVSVESHRALRRRCLLTIEP